MVSADIETARFTDDMLSRIKTGFADEAMGLLRRFDTRLLEEHQKRAIVHAVLAEGGAEIIRKMFKSGICGEQGGEFIRFMDNTEKTGVNFNLYTPISELLLAPMSLGACTGNLTLTKAIADSAVNASAWDDIFMPAVCWAGWHLDTEHLDFLKLCGFCVNRVSFYEKTPLDYAIMRSARDIIRYLRKDEISSFIRKEIKAAVMDLKDERIAGIIGVLGINFTRLTENLDHMCALGGAINPAVYGIRTNAQKVSDIKLVLKAVMFETRKRLIEAGQNTGRI